jgi:L-asparaginase II
VPNPVPLVRVIRSGVEESIHLGSIVVADEHGGVVASAGDPDRVAFARSSTKPMQAAVSLSFVHDDLSDAEVAVMCGSHNGEPVHVETVEKVLSRAGLDFSSLRCPPALPLDPAAARTVSGPRPELHNCSGKHAGMLLACVRMGFDLDSYPEPGHPLQQAILDAVGVAAGAAPVAVGIDGCGIPVHSFPLVGLATMYARLAQPEDLGSLAPAVERALRGMVAEPYMVAGRERICTLVMQAVSDVVVKVGAEGLLCAALVGRGLGIAMKVEDGSGRPWGPSLVRVLKLLGALRQEDEASIEGLARLPVLGGGRPIGEIRADFELAFA